MSEVYDIMNNTMTVTVEDNMTDMTSEHIDTLKREIEAKDRQVTSLFTDIHIISHILSELIEQEDINTAQINDILVDMTYKRDAVINVLDKHNIVPEHWFVHDYEVTVTVPVSITLTVEASNDDEAEEAALQNVEVNGLEAYDMSYEIYYNATVDEIRKV